MRYYYAKLLLIIKRAQKKIRNITIRATHFTRIEKSSDDITRNLRTIDAAQHSGTLDLLPSKEAIESPFPCPSSIRAILNA